MPVRRPRRLIVAGPRGGSSAGGSRPIPSPGPDFRRFRRRRQPPHYRPHRPRSYNRRMNSADVAALSVAAQRLRDLIAEELPRLIEFRHDLHAHPELMYEEHRTSGRVRDELAATGIEHHSGLAGGTGILAYLPGRDEGRAVGLRPDMDALP